VHQSEKVVYVPLTIDGQGWINTDNKSRATSGTWPLGKDLMIDLSRNLQTQRWCASMTDFSMQNDAAAGSCCRWTVKDD
jgi:hypothetical protein